MPKIMLEPAGPGTDLANGHMETSSTKKLNSRDKLRMDRMLRKPRSERYLKALHRLDAGGHGQNKDAVEDLIDAIKGEFPEVSIEGVLLGIVARCYLGEPYEVHTLSMADEIVEHYKKGQTLPGDLERARSLAMNKHYDYIEVYETCCRAISADGMVSVIEG